MGNVSTDDDNDELNPVDRRLQRPEAGDALGQIAHARGPAETQQQPHGDRARKEVPQEQPVAAFEIGVGTGAARGRHLGQIGFDGGVDIERVADAARGTAGDGTRVSGSVWAVAKAPSAMNNAKKKTSRVMRSIGSSCVS